MAKWNPWHGCHKYSEGCANCYVHRIDARHGRNPSIVVKTQEFNIPVRKSRTGEYKIPAGEHVYTCFTSDFLVNDADDWRPEAWQMIRQRSDLRFLFITKRIDRLKGCLPPDWGEGWDNVHICCTVENQARTDYRLPIFQQLPVKHKSIVCEPLLEKIDLSPYLGAWVEQVVVGGESGENARICDYDWVIQIRDACLNAGISFTFRQTGARFKKDGKIYTIPRYLQHSQAKKSGISFRSAYKG